MQNQSYLDKNNKYPIAHKYTLQDLLLNKKFYFTGKKTRLCKEYKCRSNQMLAIKLFLEFMKIAVEKMILEKQILLLFKHPRIVLYIKEDNKLITEIKNKVTTAHLINSDFKQYSLYCSVRRFKLFKVAIPQKYIDMLIEEVENGKRYYSLIL